MDNQYKLGFCGLLKTYPKINLLKSIVIPLLIDFVLILIIVQNETNTFELIKFISESITAIIPNILGFILTGYAVIISISEEKYLKIMVKKLKGRDVTLFQTVNSTFAFVLISLCFTLIIGFLVNLVIKSNINVLDCFVNSIDSINMTFLSILLFLILYSLFSILDIILNVFDFGQFVNKIEENT